MNRKLLYSVLIVGLAVAAASAGTAAFFNDTETAEDNTLMAGELDLKIDWNQSYNGEWVNAWPEAEGGGQADLMSRDEVAQDMFGMDYDELNETQRMEAEEAYRNQFADLPDDVERPIIELTDVKPGDEGEITFSLHLFDNPGWLWMTGELRENAENGVNEPEAKDPDEDDPEGPFSGTNMSGELVNAVDARLFYDQNGNNRFDPAPPEPMCLELVLDNSGSMDSPPQKLNETKDAAHTLITRLANQNGDPSNIDPHRVSVDFIGSSPELAQSLTNDTAAIRAAIDELDASGGLTNVNASINEAADELADCDERKVMVVLTNGGQNLGGDARVGAQNAFDDGNVDVFLTIGVLEGGSGHALLSDIANVTPGGAHFDATDLANISTAFDALLATLGGDQVIVDGKLVDVLNATSTGHGIALDGNTTAPDRQAYPNSETQYVALEWSLPVDHANEIQSDSLVFDLGFYAEQERHNNGSGMSP